MFYFTNFTTITKIWDILIIKGWYFDHLYALMQKNWITLDTNVYLWKAAFFCILPCWQNLYIFFSLLKINLAFVSCSICGHRVPRNLCFVHLVNNLLSVVPFVSGNVWNVAFLYHTSLHRSGEQATTKTESTLTNTFAYCLVMFRSRNHALSFVFSIQCLKTFEKL